MPYIVCVNQPGCLPESDPTAVATLDEARDAACERLPEQHEIGAKAREQFVCDIQMLPESGGVIGPLPDGYVIDVQRVTWDELRDLSRLPYSKAGHSLESILDAYNQQ